MTGQEAPAARAAERLRLSLEAVVDAIRDASAEDLLAAEEQLAAALAGSTQVLLAGAGDSLALPMEIAGARAALERCRELGGLVRQAGMGYLAAQGHGEYNRSGSSITPEPRGAAVRARV